MRHSYTKVATYMKCPRMKRGKYDEGIRGTASPAAQRGTDVHTYFELALLGKNELPEEFNFYNDYIKRLTLGGAVPELPMAVDRSWKPLPYESEDAWLIGVADVWTVSGKTGYGVDWKTGKEYPDHIWQKEFYSCMLADAYPEVEIFKFSNVYVDSRTEKTHTFTRQEIAELRERWTKRILLMERDDIMAPSPNPGCRFCPVSKRNGGPCQF